MTSPADISNRALSLMGARTMIQDLDTENSEAAAQCRLWYTPLRQRLLRTAPWGFARKTVTLSTLGLQTDVPSGSPYPYFVKYLYPPDCEKMRYIIPPPTPPVAGAETVDPPVSSGLLWFPWCPPSRAWRYVVAYDDTVVPARTVLLSNVTSAIGVYTADVTDCDRFDSLFTNALEAALASKLVIPLSGNAGMKRDFEAAAEYQITQARATDGNESISSTDHQVDWIQTRGVLGGYGWAGPASNGIGIPWGSWNCSYDSMNWGM